MIYRPAYDENDNEEKLCTELLDLKNIGDMVLEMQEEARIWFQILALLDFSPMGEVFFLLYTKSWRI